jgi:hypothetical protein
MKNRIRQLDGQAKILRQHRGVSLTLIAAHLGVLINLALHSNLGLMDAM